MTVTRAKFDQMVLDVVTREQEWVNGIQFAPEYDRPAKRWIRYRTADGNPIFSNVAIPEIDRRLILWDPRRLFPHEGTTEAGRRRLLRALERLEQKGAIERIAVCGRRRNHLRVLDAKPTTLTPPRLSG